MRAFLVPTPTGLQFSNFKFHVGGLERLGWFPKFYQVFSYEVSPKVVFCNAFLLFPVVVISTAEGEKVSQEKCEIENETKHKQNDSVLRIHTVFH